MVGDLGVSVEVKSVQMPAKLLVFSERKSHPVLTSTVGLRATVKSVLEGVLSHTRFYLIFLGGCQHS